MPWQTKSVPIPRCVPLVLSQRLIHGVGHAEPRSGVWWIDASEGDRARPIVRLRVVAKLLSYKARARPLWWHTAAQTAEGDYIPSRDGCADQSVDA